MGVDVEPGFTLLDETTTLVALIDNDGTVLDGIFSWFAEIPELGMSESELLGFGTVLDVLYLDPETADRELEPLIQHWGSFVALMELDFHIDELNGIGPLVYWWSYTNLFLPSQDCAELGDDILCDAWSADFSYDGGVLGTTFDYLDRAVLIPEPPAFALYTLGLLGLGLAQRKKTAFLN